MTNDLKTLPAVDEKDAPSANIEDALLAAASTAFWPDPMPPASDDLLHVARLVTIGELAACFAHEVFQPLTMIRGHIAMMKEVLPSNDPLSDSLEAMSKAEKRIEDLARRMLDFSRKRDAKYDDHPIAEVIDDALRFVQPYLLGCNVQVKVSIEKDAPRLHADRWQILQVLVNLFQNAIDSMANSPFRFLAISVNRENADLRISIADTGCGIAKSDLPKIFMPFFTTKGQQGTGLGLYITRRVVDSHGGSIAVQSTTNGTTFTVGLPAQQSVLVVEDHSCDAIGVAKHAEC
jgi:two-component system sensor histidine kinase DctS